MDFYGRFSKICRKTALDFQFTVWAILCSAVEGFSGAAMRFWGDSCMESSAHFDLIPQENDDSSTII